MDTVDTYRKLVRDVLSQHQGSDYAIGEITSKVVFDEKNDRYLVVSVGWDTGRRVHGSLIHVDIIDGKIWVQRDGTEDGVVKALEEAGVPKSDIVLGFHEPDVRPHTGYAAA